MFDRIRRRLTLGYVGILALILTVFSIVVILGFREATIHQNDDTLIIEARALADRVSRGEVDAQSMNDSDEYAWAHISTEGRILERDSTALDLGLPSGEGARKAAASGEPVVTTQSGPSGGVLVASVPMEGSRESVVQVGRSLQVEQQTVNRLVLVLAPIGLAALAMAGVGGMFMSRRAMRPVRSAFEKQRAFVADASHELKTPLSLTKIDGEVLLRDPGAQDATEILEHQLSEIDRMSALLSDLLLLARLDSGKLEVESKPFDLASVIADTVERFSKRATAGDIDLSFHTSGKLPVRGDAERTAQVLGALLDNALKFTPEGGAVTVTDGVRDGRTEAAVTDTGPGIPSEQLSQVFDRFYRAKTARAQEGGGTGLGLAIARDLARSQGGDLEADSVEGGGAIFRISLPKA